MEIIAEFMDIKTEMQEILYKIELIDYYEEYDDYKRCVFDKMEKVDNKYFIATIEYYSKEYFEKGEEPTKYEINIVQLSPNRIIILIEKPEKSKGNDDLIIKFITEIVRLTIKENC